MSDLVKELRIMAGMIQMCERIAFGSDSALMKKAATEIDRLERKNAELKSQVEKLQQSLLKCAELVNVDGGTAIDWLIDNHHDLRQQAKGE